MLQIAAALMLLLGSGLIFKALVEMDRPTFRPRTLPRPHLQDHPRTEPEAVPLRRAA